MPKLLIIRKYVFLLFSVDIHEDRNHIHVEIKKGHRRRVAKFWIEPNIELVDKGNLSNKEINETIKLIQDNIELLNTQIEKFRKGEKIRTIKK